MPAEDADGLQPDQRPGRGEAALDRAEQGVCGPEQAPRGWVSVAVRPRLTSVSALVRPCAFLCVVVRLLLGRGVL